MRVTEKFKPAQILVLGFIIMIAIGTVLLSLPVSSVLKGGTNLLTSLFTATSAVCVTGLVVVDTGTYWSTFGQTVILILIQVGGLGFMSMATFFALIIGKRITFKERLIIQESVNKISTQGVVKYVRYLIFATFAIEAIGAFFFSFRFIPIYGLKKGLGYSIFHSVSAFCNAGFDLIGGYSSFTGFKGDGLINITAITLIVLGGLGFAVLYEIVYKKDYKKLSLHSHLAIKMTLGFIAVGFIMIFLLEMRNPDTIGQLPFKDKILASLFQSITPRTAGFNTLDMASLTNGSLILIMAFMFIGGSSASIAGGVKITTIGVIFFKIKAILKGKSDVEYRNRRIPNDIVDRAIVIVGIGIAWVFFVALVLSITENDIEFIKILFETVSAFGTVGLTMGITGDLSTIGRIIIIVAMFIGRLGPLTIALALATRQKKNIRTYRYPEEKVIVG